MEHLTFEFGPFERRTPLPAPLVVGVVGSGNLEALVESAALDGKLRFDVSTSIGGFAPTWSAVLRDVAERLGRGDLLVSINDAGATPAVVVLRMRQAQAALEAAA
ncbi:MAG TPA: malonate decarboxylase acyl carrier protein [Burkholderiaceae bacterium]|nr:malonate decarboxylase acyl carrier protein [Burkholderiaceae bacterium]